MQGHNEWLERYFDEGVFLLLGSQPPNLGGGILAHNCTLAEINAIVAQDPFVENNVVSAEITTLTTQKADKKLAFLLPIEA